MGDDTETAMGQHYAGMDESGQALRAAAFRQFPRRRDDAGVLAQSVRGVLCRCWGVAKGVGDIAQSLGVETK
jgi:hypothetical protein